MYKLLMYMASFILLPIGILVLIFDRSWVGISISVFCVFYFFRSRKKIANMNSKNRSSFQNDYTVDHNSSEDVKFIPEVSLAISALSWIAMQNYLFMNFSLYAFSICGMVFGVAALMDVLPIPRKF